MFATKAGGIELVPPPGFHPNHSADGLGWSLRGQTGKTEAWIRVEVTKLPIGSREPLSMALARNPDLADVSEGRADVGGGSGNGLLLEQEGLDPKGVMGKRNGRLRHLCVVSEENGVRYKFTLVSSTENIDKHRDTLRQLMKSLKKL